MEYATLREKIRAEKAVRMSRYQAFQDIVEKAYWAGIEAGKNAMPIPMHVLENGIPIDRIDDGACGFAWVTVRPANSSFAIWAKKQGLMRPMYGGGVVDSLKCRGFLNGGRAKQSDRYTNQKGNCRHPRLTASTPSSHTTCLCTTTCGSNDISTISRS